MSETMDERLRRKFPLASKDMGSGYEVGNGWEALLADLLGIIEEEIKAGNVEDFRIDQVKEKFGTLRFYVSGDNERIDEAISMAEDISWKTCEECGKPGKLRGKRWLYVSCDEHANEGD